MENDYKVYALRFGEIAVAKSFVTPSQVQEALAEQLSNEPSIRLRPPKLIGEILLEKGLMTHEQVLAVLKELS
jgi:hypothetical protein